MWDLACCALCPGAVECDNGGKVLGMYEGGKDCLYFKSLYTLLWEWGPSIIVLYRVIRGRGRMMLRRTHDGLDTHLGLPWE